MTRRPNTPIADDAPVDALMNLGKISKRQLAEVGIASAGALRALGALAAYRRLKALWPREVSTVFLYALEGAITGTHWNRLPPEVKERLRRAAAAIAAETRAASPAHRVRRR